MKVWRLLLKPIVCVLIIAVSLSCKMGSDIISNIGKVTINISGSGQVEQKLNLVYDISGMSKLDVRDLVITGNGSMNSTDFTTVKELSNLTHLDISQTSTTVIPNNAFYLHKNLTSISLPEGLTTIGRYAFSVTSLTSITIPASVISIGESAFAICQSLTSISLPEGLTAISDSTFKSTNLTSITIPASVRRIGEKAFSDCGILTDIVLQEGFASINNDAFKSTNLTSVTIPASVNSIGSEAFNIPTLTTVTVKKSSSPTITYLPFPNSITKIYVPSESVLAYKAATNWTIFADKIEAITE